ncbi:MAG: sulfurase, partial [Sphingobacteriia bacterium]|nr:sulfurase [Sphingobacteriia bacterium]
MSLDWLRAGLERFARRFRPLPGGRVTAIFVADAAGAPMRACERTLALVDQGLADDRYALGRGFWRLTDGCQVTLILAEDLQRSVRRHGLPLDAGQHRRNLVVSGLVGVELRGRNLRVGEALLAWHRMR